MEAMKLEQYCLDLFATNPQEVFEKAKDVWDNREQFAQIVQENIKHLEQLSFKSSQLAAELLNSSRKKETELTVEKSE